MTFRVSDVMEAQVIIASDIDCLDRMTPDQFADQCRTVGQMLNRLMARLDSGG